VETTQDVVLQADKSAFKAKKIGINGGKGNGFKTGKDMSLETIDFNKKILHGSWHPRENTIAIAATNNLFLVWRVLLYSRSFLLMRPTV